MSVGGGGAASGGLLAGKAKIAVAALVVVGGGGAAFVATGGTIPFLGGSGGMVDTVPEDVDVVMYLDPSVADDEATKNLLNELSSLSGSSSSSDPGEIKENFEDQTGLKYDELNSVVVFGKYPEDGSGGGANLGPAAGAQLDSLGYGAALIDSGWSEDDFVSAMEDAPSGDASTVYEEDKYEGYTIYVQKPGEDDIEDYRQDTENPTYIGVIGDGKYVVGSEQAVKDALDVDAGNADSFSGDLRDAYDQTKDGYLKFASKVPEDQVSSGTSQVASNVNVVAGSYYTKGSDTIGMQVRMLTGDSSDAEKIKKQIDGFVATMEQSAEGEAATLLEDISVEQDGSSVTVTLESSPETVAKGLQGLGRAMMGGMMGASSGGFSSSVAGPAASYGDLAVPTREPA